MRVYFWAMRHGEKQVDGTDDPELTERGFRQIETAVRTHLVGREIATAFHSDRRRTKQTARAVLELLGSDAPMRQERNFSYTWVDDAIYPRFSFKEAERKINGEVGDGKATVHDWLRHWPPAWGVMTRFYDMMANIARTDLSGRAGEGEDIHYLIASHSPMAELCAPDPKAMLTLGFADIVRYAFELGLTQPHLAEAVRLSCPETT